jgi:ABC-type polysaccharide/polyol phosphate export permease
LFETLRSLVRHRRLVKDFVVRDLKARYVGSSMGFFWSVVFPIINLFVYMFVFRLVLNARWGDKQSAIEVAIVMLAGIVIWSAFAETISRATNTLVDNSNLIQKVVFPAEILPIYLTLSSLINMCIGLPVVLLAVFWMGHAAQPEVSLYVHHEWQPVVEDGRPILAEDGSERIRLVQVPVVLHERQHHYGVLVNLTRGWHAPVTIPFSVSGTATEGEDYRALGTRELVLPPGTIKGYINIVPLEDEQQDGAETVVIELGEPTNAELRPDGDDSPVNRHQHTVTIREWTPKDHDQYDARPEVGAISLPPVEESYHPLKLGPALLSLPLLFLLQVLFTAGLGYFLCTFNLFLRDTFHLVGVGITVWMFSTPIFYPGWMVEQKGFGWMLMINPMHWLIDMYRGVLLHSLWPPWFEVLKLAGAAALTLFIGARFFRAHSAKFPDLL